jgi:hypothetical protein
VFVDFQVLFQVPVLGLYESSNLNADWAASFFTKAARGGESSGSLLSLLKAYLHTIRSFIALTFSLFFENSKEICR